MSVTETIDLPPALARRRTARQARPHHGATWDDYENLVEQIGESRNCRIAFDGKDIEMMTLGPFHERQKSLLDWFIMVVAGELMIDASPWARQPGSGRS